MHLLSVDLEDWYTDVACVPGLDAHTARAAFMAQVTRLVTILDTSHTRCTFFVLGTTAERFPDAVIDLARAGHEIASHGYVHRRLGELDRVGFERDIERSAAVLSQITGVRPIGYRAPYFSLPRATFSPYEVLAAHGYRYSSSKQGGPREHRASVEEIPTSAVQWQHWALPVGGGGWWRAMPSTAVLALARWYARSQRGLITYVHPHELDPEPLRPQRGLWRHAYVNLGRSGIAPLLAKLLGEHSFAPYRTVLGDAI